MRWYVLQTKPKQEHIAIINLEDQGFQTFLPIYKRRRKGKWLVGPLFPGYLFINLNLRDSYWKSVNGTRGVKRIMCMDPESPSPVPTLFMETLMSSEYIEDLEKVFSPGDKLQLTDGPFKGNIGVCEVSSKKRVTLLLSILGGQHRVTVDLAKVVMAPG